MASFTGADDTDVLAFLQQKGETVTVTLVGDGTASQDIELQIEQGAIGSGAWSFIRSDNVGNNETVTYEYVTRAPNGEHLRLFLRTDAGGTVTTTIAQGDMEIRTFTDDHSNVYMRVNQSGVYFPSTKGIGVGGMITYAGETVTVGGTDELDLIAGTTTTRGALGGFTEVTGVMTATFAGNRYINIKGVMSLAPVATNTDNLSLKIVVNGADVFESADNDISDATPELFEVESTLLINNGDTIGLGVGNADTTANIVVAAYADRINATASHGYLKVTGA